MHLQNKKEKAGSIPLMNTKIGPAEYKGKKYCFAISTPGRVYHIVAGSDAEMDHWVKSLREAQNPKGKPASAMTSQPAVEEGSSDDDSVRIPHIPPLCPPCGVLLSRPHVLNSLLHLQTEFWDLFMSQSASAFDRWLLSGRFSFLTTLLRASVPLAPEPEAHFLEALMWRTTTFCV